MLLTRTVFLTQFMPTDCFSVLFMDLDVKKTLGLILGIHVK